MKFLRIGERYLGARSLRNWEDLPRPMRNARVHSYYEYLSRRNRQIRSKRLFDFLLSSLLLLLLSPLFLALAIAIKLDSKGPVFYRQERVTQYGRIFRIHKFRTMVLDADQKGSLVTVDKDNRITRMGRHLRDRRLDELPQLIDILLGDMSFVGTRPEVPKYVREYEPQMLATLLMPAGVTSQASIHYKDEAKWLASGQDVDQVYLQRILPDKMKYNLKELAHFSLLREFWTMLETVWAVLR